MAKLLYVANQRMPTEKAYGIQITKMCEAFSDTGLSVSLVLPWRMNFIREDIYTYYGVKRNFEVKKVFAPDFYLPGRLDWLAFHAKNLISALVLCSYAIIKKPDIIYSRDEIIIFLLSFVRIKNIFFEIHRFSKSRNFFYKRFKKAGVGIIAISGGIKNKLVESGFPSDKILVTHDGVDLNEFNIKMDSNEVRKMLNLPSDKKLAGYVGSFKTMGMEKGLNRALEAFSYLKDDNLRLVLVGGSEEDIKSYSKLAISLGIKDSVIFVGRVEHSEVPKYLNAFDVLLAPFPDLEHYRLYMSPLKIFEYMASGRPIVVSDLPAIREVLSEESAVLVKPGSSKSFAEGIERVINDPGLAESISQVASRDIKNYTWQKRALNIKEFITKK